MMDPMLEKIYESANSTVYKRTEPDGSLVTLKVLKPDVSNPVQLLQFNNEFDILSELDIDGVRKVRAKGYFDGSPSIVSDYIDGETLQAYIRSAPFDLVTRLRLAVRIAHTLGQVHARNIIHRDITSSNILVTADALEPLLADFGQSLKLDVRTVHLSNPERLEGSLHYFSPEQTGRMNRVVDYRSDLYSLGVVLYELFTGRLPFEESDPLKLIHAHLAVYPAAADAINPHLPGILAKIIRVLMAKNAEERYQSAFGLEVDLQRVLDAVAAGQAPGVFDLSHDKVFTKFQVPQKLYGRDREIQFLLKTFEDVSDGTGQVMLISGYSGVG
jgi:serine/threonine protein kinase